MGQRQSGHRAAYFIATLPAREVCGTLLLVDVQRFPALPLPAFTLEPLQVVEKVPLRATESFDEPSP